MSDDLISKKQVLEVLEKVFIEYKMSYGEHYGGFAEAIPKAIENIPPVHDQNKPILCGQHIGGMDESEKKLWLDGDDGLKPFLRLKNKGMPKGKVEQIAWLLLNGSGCGFCKICRDEPCNMKDGESCTVNIANYIRKIVKEEQQ